MFMFSVSENPTLKFAPTVEPRYEADLDSRLREINPHGGKPRMTSLPRYAHTCSRCIRTCPWCIHDNTVFHGGCTLAPRWLHACSRWIRDSALSLSSFIQCLRVVQLGYALRPCTCLHAPLYPPSFLAQQNNEQSRSLVEFVQAFILDDSELWSPTHTRLAQADLNEVKSLHENASTANQKRVIEALIGAELLNRHRDEIITELQSTLTNLHGLLRARPMPHSPFGIADPISVFRYDASGRFSKLAVVKENVDSVSLKPLCKTLQTASILKAEGHLVSHLDDISIFLTSSRR
ncbi:hypothetical protein Y032_0100g3229 [Ancylostoma ceylanicum]|nr:hypothetical protein Y032_0100g3229 [Ancylostoma ceylanicum]